MDECDLANAKRLRKQTIPKAVKEQLWLTHMGKRFEGKCRTSWCKNTITIFDFQCGHNIPESKGGATTLDNLVPICSRCNTSMSNNFTFNDWSLKYNPTVTNWKRYFSCIIFKKKIQSVEKPSG
jgi:5-methylcytosine-specific restriction endonuclease McrA